MWVMYIYILILYYFGFWQKCEIWSDVEIWYCLENLANIGFGFFVFVIRIGTHWGRPEESMMYIWCVHNTKKRIPNKNESESFVRLAPFINVYVRFAEIRFHRADSVCVFKILKLYCKTHVSFRVPTAYLSFVFALSIQIGERNERKKRG